ncbi:hypothetical protein Droror1_Dr00016592 [Drosera rotundifolia]
MLGLMLVPLPPVHFCVIYPVLYIDFFVPLVYIFLNECNNVIISLHWVIRYKPYYESILAFVFINLIFRYYTSFNRHMCFMAHDSFKQVSNFPELLVSAGPFLNTSVMI